MKINNYYLLIFAFIAVSVKWYVSFYLFSESLDTKIIHDSVSDAKYYYPLIKFLSEFNLNYSYDPEITNLRSVPLPFWGIFFHSIFLKIFGFYSFIILDFIFIYLILLVFFYIFNVFLSREISIVFSIFIFLIPYLISTSSLNDIQYLNLFSKTLYGLRVPRPMVTNLYFFTFLLLTLKLVTSKFHNIKIFFSLGLITALSLSSFYYHFFTESIMLLVILISKFKTNLLIELKKNFKYYLVFILTFLFFSTPFF
jgi:hypothetical protein